MPNAPFISRTIMKRKGKENFKKRERETKEKGSFPSIYPSSPEKSKLKIKYKKNYAKSSKPFIMTQSTT